MDDVAVARVVHVLAVIHWLGGVAFVTAVVLPLSRRLPASEGPALFERVEHRFSRQVKVSVVLAGLSGAWMAQRLGLWPLFGQRDGWWLSAMAGLWLVFMLILFVVEPLLARRGRAWPASLGLLQTGHWLLLAVGAAVTAGALLGAHGLLE